MIEWIRRTLDRFGVHFDSWFSEAALEESGGIDEAVKLLREAGYAYDAEGAVWFRSTAFGDDKDRVLIRGTGAPTYFAKDVAYLRDKFARGFDRLVYVWGADHHGDVVRVRGAAQALGYDPDAMEFVLYQFVSLYRAGEAVKMSKRAGDLITLDELLDEVGPDAARYTLLARSSDSPIDFDIEVVTRQTMDNPVYYVQYAHARIASLLRVAEERGVHLPPWHAGGPERPDRAGRARPAARALGVPRDRRGGGGRPDAAPPRPLHRVGGRRVPPLLQRVPGHRRRGRAHARAPVAVGRARSR